MGAKVVIIMSREMQGGFARCERFWFNTTRYRITYAFRSPPLQPHPRLAISFRHPNLLPQ